MTGASSGEAVAPRAGGKQDVVNRDEGVTLKSCYRRK